MDNLDSLLSDLQTSRRTFDRKSGNFEDRPVSPVQSIPETATKQLQYCYQMNSDPIYQNQHVIKETITAHSTSERAQSPIRAANNLSELDSLVGNLCPNGTPMRTTSEYTIRTEKNSSSTLPARSPTMRTDYNMENMLDELRSTLPKSSGASTTYKYQQQTQNQRVYSNPPKIANVSSASNATKELDSLMASLSEFRLRDPYYTSSHPHRQETHQVSSSQLHRPQPQKQLLDSMLGSLKEDMNSQGVNTTAKGHCAACKKPIVGQVVTALAKTWHPEHFVCAHCNQELGTKNFYERDGEPYCETDYHNIFSPRCSYCNGPILDKCVTALDKTWHPEHFFCAQCGKQFGEEGFHEKNGKPYCRDDYFAMFAPKCGGCNMPITENYISALSMQWHPECFVCRDCLQPFQGGSFYDYEGQPYCETHYHAKRGSLCAGCHKPISGRCITAMFRKYHPEHFVCSFCLKQLNKGTFKEENDKPYCHDCFEKLYS